MHRFGQPDVARDAAPGGLPVSRRLAFHGRQSSSHCAERLPWYKLRAMRVFRDQTGLAAASKLPRKIQAAQGDGLISEAANVRIREHLR